MKIYDYTDYKKFIKDWVETQKNLGISITFQDLAREMRIQKTYLSRVLNSDAHLNADQIFHLCESFNLSQQEERYAQLLLGYQRCQISERKTKLYAEIIKIQNFHLKTDHRLKKTAIMNSTQSEQEEDYFLNSWNQVVHIGLLIPRFRKKPEVLRESLGLSPKHFQEILSLLERIQVIESTKKEIKVLRDSIHLPRKSKHFWSWYNQISTSSRERFRNKANEDDLNFSVTFTANKETATYLKQKFLEFLEEAQEKVLDSPSRELYQMNFDLGSWEL